MFTSEPSLAQRIERMIGDTPIIDARARICRDRPGVPDLAALMLGGHGVETGLMAVGMPASDLDPALPADERVRRSLPYLGRMRNTTAAWCLFRIFRDLHDFDEPQLTEANYRGLFDKVAKAGQDPAWARSVLRDRANIRAVVTGTDETGPVEPRGLDGFFARLDLDVLARPDASPGGYLEALGALLGGRPTSAGQLDRLIADRLDRAVARGFRCVGLSLPAGRRPARPEPATVDALLAKGGETRSLPAEGLGPVVDQACWSVMGWHREHRRTLQVALADAPGEDGPGDPGTVGGWAAGMARAFRQFAGARFDLLASSGPLAEGVALLAGQLPHVYGSAGWGPESSPPTIERAVGIWVQVAPMAKVGGFASEARHAEWSYARLQVVRKATAAALARLVDARFFEEDEIPPLLRQILHDTPEELYGLGDA